MSVEKIIEKIIADAKKEATQIIEEAEEQARTIHDQHKREADGYFHGQRKRLEERYRREKERAILNRRLEMRKNILHARQEWMEKAFSDAYKRLVEQPISEYKTLIINLIQHASGSDKKQEIIFGTKGSEKELQTVVDELNKKTGGRFTLSQERGEFSWGFILKKGNVVTDMSIDSLFKYRRTELEQKAWEIFNAELS